MGVQNSRAGFDLRPSFMTNPRKSLPSVYHASHKQVASTPPPPHTAHHHHQLLGARHEAWTVSSVIHHPHHRCRQNATLSSRRAPHSGHPRVGISRTALSIPKLLDIHPGPNQPTCFPGRHVARAEQGVSTVCRHNGGGKLGGLQRANRGVWGFHPHHEGGKLGGLQRASRGVWGLHPHHEGAKLGGLQRANRGVWGFHPHHEGHRAADDPKTTAKTARHLQRAATQKICLRHHRQAASDGHRTTPTTDGDGTVAR